MGQNSEGAKDVEIPIRVIGIPSRYRGGTIKPAPFSKNFQFCDHQLPTTNRIWWQFGNVDR